MNKKIILILLVFLFIPLAKAITTIDIDIKDVFRLGETISFDYTFISDESINITYLTHIECPTAPVPPLDEKSATLEANLPFEKTFTSGIVKDFFEPQACSANIQILSPFQKTKQKNFTIDTPPSFVFNILTCQDRNCDEKAKVFILDEKIYLDYTSEVIEPAITATLTLPDETTQQLTLPTSIKAEQIGTYDLEITASKQDYKTITKKTQFGVIEEEARIGYEAVEKEVRRVGTLVVILIITVVIILLAFVGLELYRLKSTKVRDITEIQTYIQVNFQRGYTTTQIKQALLKVGWKEKLIDKAFVETLKKK